jgi:glycosyltransferase involved in cell wall biosynthesis
MLTVMMATHNGIGTLPQVLEAYTALEAPEGGWSVVVADNASTDGTKDVVQGFIGRLPLTYVYEAQLGKNYALNAALPAAHGDLIVFTDDDAVPRPDWLRQFRAAADQHDEFDIFGGTIVPRWPTVPEPWILSVVPLPVVYGLNARRQSGPVGRQAVFGANMAVRRSLFDLGYRFDSTIGPRGTDYAGGSEAELTQRLERDGHRAWFCSEAVVEHLIRPQHLEETWILGRARRYGRGRARLDGSTPSVRALARLVMQGVRVLVARARRDRTRLFEARWSWNYLLGQVQESRARRRLRPAR